MLASYEMGGLFDTSSRTVQQCHPTGNYKSKNKPTISVRGGPCGTFNYPWGVCIDSVSGYIYVGEQNSDRVQAFNSEGCFLYSFGIAEMSSPLGIAIFREKMFITQYDNSYLLTYDLNGEYISKFDMGYGQRFQLRGIAVNERNEDIYVCDVTNKRVQIISDSFHLSHFAIGVVDSPIDIQITERNIVVLSNQNPYIYTFDFDFNVVQNLIPDKVYESLHSPNGFFIDELGTYIISNFRNRDVVIVDHKGTLVNTLSDVDTPIGVRVDSKGRIVVVGHNHKLLIF